MDEPLLLPCKTTLKQPSGGGLYVKHFILTAKSLEPEVEVRPLPFSNSFMTKDLISKGSSQEVWENLIAVQFKSYTEDGIRDILTKNVEYNGTVYRFLGFSSAQLKEKTCCFLRQRDEAHNFLKRPFVSSFARIAQKAAVVQRLFQPFEKCLEVTFDFPATEKSADLIGYMSTELAERIQTECELPEVPSVVQFICEEFSGVLLKIHKKDNEIQEHFNGSVSPIECSRPYTIGYLDVIAMKLLVERGISREYFVHLQECNLHLLKNLKDLSCAKRFLRQIGKQILLKKIEDRISEEEHIELIRIRSEEISKRQGRNMSNFRVFVPKSREVFGIKDQNSLECDECVFSPTLRSESEEADFEEAEKVVVILQPCYKAEHIVTLRLNRDKRNYDHLKDCIVLPFHFATHAAAKKYFVSWDKHLVPQPNSSSWAGIMRVANGLFCSCLAPNRGIKTALCLNKTKAVEVSHISSEEEIQRYFAKLTIVNPEELVSLAELLFIEESNVRGPSCSTCEKLGEFLSPDFDWYENGETAKEYLKKFKRQESRTSDELVKESSNVDQESEAEDDESTELLPVGTSVSEDVWKKMRRRLQEFSENLEAGTNSSQE